MSKFTAQNRRHAAPISLPRYRASFNVYADSTKDGQYSGQWSIGVECKHAHLTPESAEACGDETAAYIERNGRCPSWADDNGQIAQVEGWNS